METSEEEITVLDNTVSNDTTFDPRGFTPSEVDAITEMMVEEKARSIHSTDNAIPFIILRVLNYGVIPIFVPEAKMKDTTGALYDTRIKLTNTVFGIPRDSLSGDESPAALLARAMILPLGTVIYVTGFYVPDYLTKRWIWEMFVKPTTAENVRLKYNPTDLKGAPPPVIPLMISPALYSADSKTPIIKYIHAERLERDILDYVAHFSGFTAMHSKRAKYERFLKDVVAVPTPMLDPQPVKFDKDLVQFVKAHNIPIYKTADPNAIILAIIHSGLYDTYTRYYIKNDKRALSNANDDEEGALFSRIAVIAPRAMYNIQEQIEISLYEFAYVTLYGMQEYNKLNITDGARTRTLNNVKAAIPKARLADVKSEVEHIRETQRIFMNNKCPHIPVLQEFYHADTVDRIARALSNISEFIGDKKITKAIDELPREIRISFSNADLKKMDADEEQQKAIENLVVDIAGGEKVVAPAVPEDKYDTYIPCNVCEFRLVCPHRILAARYQIGQIRRFSDMRDVFEKFVDKEVGVDNSVICRICGEVLYVRDDGLSSIVQTVTLQSTDEQELWRYAQRMLSEFVVLNVILDRNHIIRDMINVCYASIAAKLATLSYQDRPEQWHEIYARTAFAAFLLNMETRSGGAIHFDYKKFKTTVPIAQQKRSATDIEEYRTRFANKTKNVEVYNRAETKLTWTTVNPSIKFALYMYRKPPTVAEALKLIPNAAECAAAIKAGKLDMGFMYKKLYILPRSAKVSAEADPIWRLQSRPSKEDDLREQNLRLIFNKTVKYLQSGIWADVDAGDDRHANNPRITPQAILDDIATVDALATLKMSIIRQPARINFPGTPNVPMKYSVSLRALFDPLTKRRQMWDTFVYRAEDVPSGMGVPAHDGHVFIKIAGCSAYLLKGAKAVDLYCESTKTLMSATAVIEDMSVEDDIREIFRDGSNMDSMINFFTHKCPLGDSHEYGNQDGMTAAAMSASVCSKCGRSKALTEATKRDYYTKYKNIYELQKLELQKTEMEDYKEETHVSISASIEATASDMPQLTEDIIQSLSARLTGIHPNQIRFFGQLQGITLADVLAEDFMPPALLNGFAYPVGLVEGFITAYFKFKISKSASFPEYKDFRAVYRAQRLSTDTAVLINWMRFVLFNDVLDYYNAFPADAEFIVRQLLREDSLLCMNEAIINQATDLNEYVDEPDISAIIDAAAGDEEEEPRTKGKADD